MRLNIISPFLLPRQGLTQNTTTPFDPLTYINPLIGSTNGGNVFAGASLPYGLAKASPNVDGLNTGGFATDGSNITGFSPLHDSGTGGNPSLGNYPLFPQLCPDDGDVNSCAFRIGDRKVGYVADSVVARPGYFAVELENGIQTAMTVAAKTALFNFTFAQGNGSASHPLVLLDLTDLWQSRQNASIAVDETTGRMTGNGTFLPSFGAGSYQAFFCVDFFGAENIFESGVWVNNRAGTEPKELFVTRGFNLFFIEAGAFVRFSPGTPSILARMGVSFKSTAQACANAEADIPDPTGEFDTLITTAQDAWRQKLNPISIEPGGASVELQTTFWSGLYRTMMSPQNYTGENERWETPGVPYFDSFYCIWDSFRTQHPLLTILDPLAQTQMVNSLLDIYQHEGWLPDCHMSLCNGWTQGGSNADNVLVDAYVKNLSTAIDWNVALEAIVQDAEVEPLEWSKQGRGGLASWKALDYIPYLDFDPSGFGTDSRSISRTLEYSYNDFNLAVLAAGLDRPDLDSKYLARSTNWQNLWRADQTSQINGSDTGFTGFFQPKYLNGTWGFQDPIACSTVSGTFCSLTTNPSETFEASIWQYQFLVPQDMAGLISLMGGDDRFVDRLNFFHESGLADISNEPVFLTVFLYHYAGRPGLSASRIHTYIPASFTATNDGLPGNDDSGAMGSFLFFSMLGLFPVAGQDVYLISAPFFESVSVVHPVTGRTASVKVVGGWDATYASGVFIQNVTVNGEAWTKNWIGHAFFTEGWTMEIVLGAEESGWGTNVEDRPPSFAGGGAMRL